MLGSRSSSCSLSFIRIQCSPSLPASLACSAPPSLSLQRVVRPSGFSTSGGGRYILLFSCRNGPRASHRRLCLCLCLCLCVVCLVGLSVSVFICGARARVVQPGARRPRLPVLVTSPSARLPSCTHAGARGTPSCTQCTRCRVHARFHESIHGRNDMISSGLQTSRRAERLARAPCARAVASAGAATRRPRER